MCDENVVSHFVQMYIRCVTFCLSIRIKKWLKWNEVDIA